MAEMSLLTSICNLSWLVVFEGFFSRPNKTTFNFLSGVVDLIGWKLGIVATGVWLSFVKVLLALQFCWLVFNSLCCLVHVQCEHKYGVDSLKLSKAGQKRPAHVWWIHPWHFSSWKTTSWLSVNQYCTITNYTYLTLFIFFRIRTSCFLLSNVGWRGIVYWLLPLAFLSWLGGGHSTSSPIIAKRTTPEI